MGTGLVASLARPGGGNITGLSLLNPELSGKRLELLKEVVPGLSRVAILWHGGHQGATLAMPEMEAASRVLAMRLQSLEVRGPADFERSFEAATTEGTKVLIRIVQCTFRC